MLKLYNEDHSHFMNQNKAEVLWNSFIIALSSNNLIADFPLNNKRSL